MNTHDITLLAIGGTFGAYLVLLIAVLGGVLRDRQQAAQPDQLATVPTQIDD